MMDNIVMPAFGIVIFGLLFLFVAAAGTVFWIWMLVDCARNETDEGNTRVVWTLIILFTHGLGALLYFLIRRPERRSRLGR